jgi:nucleotide-binding universal stress UspA family protein
MVPLDGTAESEVVLSFARKLATATSATVVLTYVVPTIDTATGELAVSATFSPTATAAVLDLARDDAVRYLESKASELRREGIDVRTWVSRGRTAPQLAMAARDEHADLVILATHGRSGLEGALSGSVAARLLGDVRVPTMLVRIEKGA